MDATPFYNPIRPLRFRGISDSLAATHLEASECCLIHADNPLSAKKGVWLNPRVRVGYSVQAYESVHPGVSLSSSPAGRDEEAMEKEEDPWISATQVLFGIWQNRFRRWFTTDALKTSVVRHRLDDWRRSIRSRSKEATSGKGGSGVDDRNIGLEEDDERGWFCLINEMQVLVANGWAHV